MPRRVMEGVVVSTKQDKTAIVRVERRFLHPLLKKTVRRSSATTHMTKTMLPSKVRQSPFVSVRRVRS